MAKRYLDEEGLSDYDSMIKDVISSKTKNIIWTDKLQRKFEEWKQNNNTPNATEEDFIEHLYSSDNNLSWGTF